MSKKNSNSEKVITVPFPQKTKRASYLDSLPLPRLLQILVMIGLLATVPAAVTLTLLSVWKIASTMWAVSFFFMFLLWALEHRMNKDFDTYIEED